MADYKQDPYNEKTVHEQPGEPVVGEVFAAENADHLQRRLGNRQIQLIAIGGSIGTAVFVSIGGALTRGGPGSLLIAFIIYSVMLALINNCIAEMTVLHPVSGGFVRMAGHFVDDAFGFMAGWNFYIYEGILIPFEIVALNIVLGYWSNDIPVAAVCAACIVSYAALNLLAVKAYGEAEFWLSTGKVLLIFMVFLFTFVTMVGGNPQGDAYGFRYWNNPGAFAEFRSEGTLGRFEGFLACLWSASFTIVGPEYISMVAAEAKRPRVYIKNAYKTVYWRFAIFFIGSALCIGIVVPYDDETLVAILTGESSGSGTAAASPYVIACRELGVSGFPHIVNALLCTSIYSAGNMYVYCTTRTLYGLALEGRAPRILTKCTKSGVPIYCFGITLLFALLSFLQVGSGSAIVLNWLINLITAGGVINFIVMGVTYIFFYRACKAQGVDRQQFPYTGYFQPYCGYIGTAWMCGIVLCYGYSGLSPFDVGTFMSYYLLLMIAPCTYTLWKVLKKTKIVKPLEADLIWERPIVDAYEESFLTPPVGFWAEIAQLFGIGRDKKDRRGSTASY